MTLPVTIVVRVIRPGRRATVLREDLAVRLRHASVVPGAWGYVRVTFDDKLASEAWDCVRAALDDLARDWSEYLYLAPRAVICLRAESRIWE